MCKSEAILLEGQKQKERKKEGRETCTWDGRTGKEDKKQQKERKG